MSKRRQDSFQLLPDVPGAGGTLPVSKAAALRLIGEVVYAVRVGDVIKIGHTTNMAARCRKLGSSDVLALVPGTRAEETAIHERLREHLHHGQEWYFPTPGVLAVVNEMRERLGLEPVA